MVAVNNHSSLQKRLILTISSLALLLGLIFSSLIVVIEHRSIEQSTIERVNELSLAQIDSLSISIYSFDSEAVELNLLALTKQTEITHARILQPNEQYNLSKQEVIFDINYTSSLGDELIGHLIIGINHEHIKDQLTRLTINLSLVIIALIICISGISYFVFHLIVLRHLGNVCHQLQVFHDVDSKLNLKIDRGDIKFNDELQLLVNSFNSLLQQVDEHKVKQKASFTELESYKNNLEKTVKERTEKYKNAKLLAEQASKAKSNFMSNMSHEIRTPANGIFGMTQLLSKTQTSDEQKNFINKIKLSSQNLLRVINEILDYSKIEAGKVQIELVEVDLNKLLQEIMSVFSSQCNEKGLYLYLELNWQGSANIITDPTRLGQILSNFMSNAIKFCKKGGIKLSVTLNDSNFKMSVEDTGIGIDQETCKKLFQPFVQADISTTREFGGTGLGLTICQSFVDLMDGTLEFSSKIGVGSKFEVTLPTNVMHPEIKKEITNIDNIHRIIYLGNDPILSNHIDFLCQQVNISFTQCESVEDIQEKSDSAILYEHTSFLNGKTFSVPCEKIINKTLDWAIFKFPMSNDEFCEALIKTSTETKNPTTQNKQSNLISECLDSNTQEITPNPNSELFKGYEILLVEDNFLNHEIAKTLLEQSGTTVTSAYDGQEALNELSKKSFDLVLLDIQMPVMDGLECIQTIRKDDALKNNKVVAFTALVNEEEIQNFKTKGFDDHLPKPFEEDQLVSVLKKWLLNNL